MKTLSIVFATMLIIAGCQAVATWDSTSAYDAELRAWSEFHDVIGAGMPLAEAVRVLENRGFAKCAEPGPVKQIAKVGTECLTLARHTNSGRLDVRLYSQAGKVTYFQTAHFSETIQMHENGEATRDDVLRFVALQMPVEDAVRILEKQGFKRIPRSGYFSSSTHLPASVKNPNWMVFEKRSRPEGYPSTVEIRILPEDGKVKDVEADTLPIPCL